MEIVTVSSIKDVGPAWDLLTVDYYQKTVFLQHCERYNPCGQKYFLLYEEKELIAGAITYELKINLLSYMSGWFGKRMIVCGVPASVSSSGFVGDQKRYELLLRSVCETSDKMFLALNMDIEIGEITGEGLPSIELKKQFDSFEAYLKALRATHRRRVKNIEKSLSSLNEVVSTCENIDYSLYLQVVNKSSNKLEVLSKQFFVNLPKEFELHSFYKDKKVLGWYILLQDDKVMRFFLGGVDYHENRINNVYLCMLLSMTKKYCDSPCLTLDYGQTAEIPKMFFGGEARNKYMFAHSKNNLATLFLNTFKKALSYDFKPITTTVFKK